MWPDNKPIRALVIWSIDVPIAISEPELESKLHRHAQASSIRFSKRGLALSILEAAVSAADRRRVSIARIIEELNPVKHKRTTKKKPHKPATPPLRLSMDDET